LLAVCENPGDRFCTTPRTWILAVTTTTHRSLGLRRHLGGPGPEMMFSEKTTYGLTRGQPRQRTRPAAETPVEEPVTETIDEHIQAPLESDIVIEGVETAAPISEETPIDSNPNFFDWNGELVPMTGPYTSRDGYRWMHGVPAFLHEDRPVSNIR
jgi:hypothetical protein